MTRGLASQLGCWYPLLYTRTVFHISITWVVSLNYKWLVKTCSHDPHVVRIMCTEFLYMFCFTPNIMLALGIGRRHFHIYHVQDTKAH